MARWRKWSPHHVSKLRIMWRHGITAEVIAANLPGQFSAASVFQKARNLGLSHRLHWRWSDDEADRITAMWAAGKSSSCIAKALGRRTSRAAVLGKIRRLGLTRRPAGPQPSRRRRTPSSEVARRAMVESLFATGGHVS